MGVTVTEALMALGDFAVDIEPSPEVLRHLLDDSGEPLAGRHVRIYDDLDRLLYTGVYLSATVGGIEKATIKGRGLEWWDGEEADGPLIIERDYPAGTGKGSDPSFEASGSFPVGQDVLLYWKVGQDSAWHVGGGGRTGAAAIGVFTDPLQDDLLESEESWETKPGWSYDAWAWIYRAWGTGVGRIRLRVVFDGVFRPPDLSVNGSFSQGNAHWTPNPTDDPVTDMQVVDGVMVCGPNTRWQRVVDPLLANGLADYAYGIGFSMSTGWNAFLGTAETNGGIGSPKWIQPIAHPGVSTPFEAAAGDRYRWEVVAQSDVGAPADGSAHLSVLMQGGAEPDRWDQGPSVTTNGISGSGEQRLVYEYEVPADRGSCVPTVEIRDHTNTGNWYISHFLLTRLVGNRATRYGEWFEVISGRTYRITGHIKAAPGYVDGEFHPMVTLAATHRPYLVLQGAPISKPDTTDQLWGFEFYVPSGFEAAQPALVSTDIIGGPLLVWDVQIHDTDDKTWAVENILYGLASGGTQLRVSATAPDGAERVRGPVVVAEQGGGGWVVDDVDIARTKVTPKSIAEILDELLRDPVTGSYYCLVPGDFAAPGLIQHDWLIHNLHNLDARSHLCRSGLANKVLEWRANPDFTLDVAPTVGEDRTDIVLVGGPRGDVFLASDPEVEHTAEKRITDLHLVGAEKTTPSGRKLLITGDASTGAGAMVDRFGHSVRRTRLVQDSSADNSPYARNLAAYQLERNNRPAREVRVGVGDLAALELKGPIRVGDSIYVYLPEGGVEDPANEQSWYGEAIWPEKIRVKAATTHLGGGRVEILVAGQDPIDITEHVLWDDKTQAELTVGDVLPDFAVDPGSGAPNDQLLRLRASSPR